MAQSARLILIIFFTAALAKRNPEVAALQVGVVSISRNVLAAICLFGPTVHSSSKVRDVSLFIVILFKTPNFHLHQHVKTNTGM